jgi:type II secretory pathway pseudopilin PulG
MAGRSPRSRRFSGEDGFLMVALLVALSVMGVMRSVALPAWNTRARREKETELIWRGQQYARAIAMFQRKYANTPPPTIDVLISERFLRKKYLDPITNDEFELITPASTIEGSATPAALQGRGGATGARGGATATGSTSTSLLNRGTGSAAGNAGNTGARGATGSGTRGLSQQPFSLNSSFGAATTGAGRGQTGQTAQGQRGAAGSGSLFTAPPGGGAAGGIQGVRSKSKDQSLRVYNGAERYYDWVFLASQMANIVSSPSGGQAPGGGRGRGQTPGPAGATGGRGQTFGTGPGRGPAPVPSGSSRGVTGAIPRGGTPPPAPAPARGGR